MESMSTKRSSQEEHVSKCNGKWEGAGGHARCWGVQSQKSRCCGTLHFLGEPYLIIGAYASPQEEEPESKGRLRAKVGSHNEGED